MTSPCARLLATSRTPRLHPFVLRLHCTSIDSPSPHIQVPLSPHLKTSVEDRRIALVLPANATSARRLDWPVIPRHTRRARPLPRKSRRCSGSYFSGCASYCIYARLTPFSYVPLSSFRPRPPAPYASFPSFHLAFGHQTLLHALRPCTRRLALGYSFT